MICLEFRRAVMIDPRRIDPAARAHADGCAACGEFLAHTLELDKRLAESLRIPPPAAPLERLLRQATGQPQARRWLALAASIVVAIALAAVLAWPRNDPLALAGIDFVVYEEAQAIVDAKPSDPAVLRRVASGMGIRLPAQLGEIRYVGTCPFGETTAHHVVVKSALGKVTLLLLPERGVAARLAAAARGLDAAVVPASVAGSIAIIGGSARSVQRAETLLKST